MEAPEEYEAVMDERLETPDLEDAWRSEVLRTLQGIEALLAQLVARTPGRATPTETAAALVEPPQDQEPLGTWILTDERVSRIEEAILQEQRVRGQVYGG